VATDRSQAVSVVGLAELQRDLRAIDASLPRELQKTNKAAAEHMAIRMRARAQSLGSTAAHIAPSIKAAAEQRASKVHIGGARYPMALGANFGAGHDQPRATSRGTVLGWNQFPEWGGNQFGGGTDRIVYFTIQREQREWVAMFERMIDDLTRRAFPDGRKSAP